MLNSVNQIRVELQEIASAHLQINDFFWGDFLRAYKENTELNYVLMGCFYPTASLLNNQTQLTLTIYICDRVYKDYSNLNDVESDTLQICRDVYNVINSSFRWKRIGRVQGATCQKFIERGGDEVAGHTLTIQFLLRDKSGICELPMQGYDFDQPVVVPSECEPAELVILDTDGSTLYSLSLLSGSTNNQTIQDATWLLQNTVPTTLLTGSILAEGSAIIEAPDSSWELENTDGTALGGNNIPSGDNYLIIAPDGTAHIKHSQGGTIANVLVPSGATELYTVADSDIEINGNYEFSIHATHTFDIRLKDQSNNTITPTSITSNPNHADIVINMAGPVGATLLKTNQTVQYRAGDDGDIEAGRATSFLVLASNNPFGNTDRFTDILGGQTYATAVVIDWSTYNGSTVLGYSKNYFGLNDTWNTAIDGAAALSIGTFNSGWRLTNRRELENIINEAGAGTRVLNYAPFSISIDYNFWSSTTAQYDTTRAYILGSNSTGWVYALPKASAACSYIACRTFTVTGTILT